MALIYFTVRFDIASGKEEEIDHFLAKEAKPYWMAQAGVKSFSVLASVKDINSLGNGRPGVAWPDRTIIVEVEDLPTLSRLLESAERLRLRDKLATLASNVQSAVLSKVL